MDPKRKTELLQRLRADLGNPSVSRIPEYDLMLALESARKEYSKHRGTLTIDSFVTVANQDEYEYDTDVVIRIIDVLPEGRLFNWEEFGIRDDLRIRVGDMTAYDNPSTVIIREIKNRMQRREFDGTWEDRNGKIALIRAPTASGLTIYYAYRKSMAYEDIPARDEDLLMMWATAEALQKMTIRGLDPDQIKSASGGGQSISYGGATFTETRKAIRELRNDFNVKVMING